MEPEFDLGPLRAQLETDGYVTTDPSFNLCPTVGCVDIVDVVRRGQRSLFCGRSEADDAVYQMLQTHGLPHLERRWADESYVQYGVPNSARPLSRILLAEQPSGAASATSMDLAEVLGKTRHLLELVARQTGSVPNDLSWLKLAFSTDRGGEVLLVPPLVAAHGGSLEAAFGKLLVEGEALASPGNIPKIRRAFSSSN